MSRKKKNTVDYFPHLIEPGKSMFIIESTHKNDGYAVWFKILERLGKSENHFIDLGDQKELMYVASKCYVSTDLLTEIIGDLVQLGEFDEQLWTKKQVIWCQKFIDNIADVYKRRDAELPTLEQVCTTYKLKCQHINDNDDDGTHSKVKDSIVEEKKVLTPLQNFIKSSFPNVCKLKTQLTAEESDKLEEKYLKELIAAKLEAMENKADLKKRYISVYLTLNNWCRMAVDRGEWKRLVFTNEIKGQPPEMTQKQATKEYDAFIKNNPEAAKRMANVGKI